jgi:hypothetical protein
MRRRTFERITAQIDKAEEVVAAAPFRRESSYRRPAREVEADAVAFEGFSTFSPMPPVAPSFSRSLGGPPKVAKRLG